MKKRVCLDFDGVIHSYTSGWKGPRTITDPPVKNALCAIIEYINAGLEVNIYSARSRYLFGRLAIKWWLYSEYMKAMREPRNLPELMREWVCKTAFCDPWNEECDYAVLRLLRLLKFPRHKPPALMYIDDRGYQFEGFFPDPSVIQSFKPWNKRGSV